MNTNSQPDKGHTRVRFIQSVASAREGFNTGEVADLPDHIAKAWMAGGVCVPFEDTTSVRKFVPVTSVSVEPEKTGEPAGDGTPETDGKNEETGKTGEKPGKTKSGKRRKK